MTTWTPKTKQAETWTEQVPATRGFDPAGFDNNPRFDTGSLAGIWTEKVQQPEIWTAV